MKVEKETISYMSQCDFTRKVTFPVILSFLLTLVIGCQKHTRTDQTGSEKELLIKANRYLASYHEGPSPANHIIKVVYFHGKDLKPLNNWQERLPRVLEDVSNYYKEQFARFGISIDGLPFEKKDGKFAFYEVEGDSASQSYGIRSGGRVFKEIDRKSDEIDLSRDFILVLTGLSYKRDDSTHVFHSPYHGTGSNANGICIVADCEWLDSKNLTNTEQKMAFQEMFVDYKECSVAEFNSWYIGGIAHEMGHVFALPHDYGHPDEIGESSISLMGEHGSRHYRDYLWGGEKSSVFSAAGVLQLLSHPIFTNSDRAVGKEVKVELKGISVDSSAMGLQLNIDMEANEQPYAGVALVRRLNQSEYFNQSYFNLVEGREIAIDLSGLTQGYYVLRILLLFPNGTNFGIHRLLNVQSEQKAMVIEMPGNRRVDVKELYERLQSQKGTDGIGQKLEILKGIIDNPEPIDPKVFKEQKLALSDTQWEKAEVGWDKVARNYFSLESEFKFFLQLKEKIYSKGIYAHSPSSFVFDLERKWKNFSAIVGIRDYAHKQGSAKFTIIGDGKVLYESQALRVNQQEKVEVDISGVKKLELKADGTEGHNHNSWAIWVDPFIER